jgi:segregation and condensation protein A
MQYHFELEQFQGPLDVLLQLIEREKLDITQVSLAKITDQFLAYIDQNQDIPLEHLAVFLSIATRLILIKSRALLPILTFTEEEEESIHDLEEHLRLYQLYREQAQRLEILFNTEKRLFARESFLGFKSVYYPPTDIDVHDLKDALLGILGTIEPLVSLPEQELMTIVTLEERILHFKQHLTERVEMSFHEFLGSTTERLDIIVSFLAVLELVKQRYLHAKQPLGNRAITLTRVETTV